MLLAPKILKKGEETISYTSARVKTPSKGKDEGSTRETETSTASTEKWNASA
jgi:hypothetical protein